MTSHSIRGKLIRRLSLVLILFAVATNTALYFYLKEELLEQYDESLLTEARAIAAIWQPTDQPARQAKTIARVFPQLRFDGPDGDYLRVVNGNGTTMLHVPQVDTNELGLSTPAPRKRQRAFNLVLPDGRAGRGIQVIVDTQQSTESDEKRKPKYLLTLAEGRDEFEDTCVHLAWSLLLIGGGLSAASIWLVVNGVRKELRKVSAFSDSVGRLDVDSLAYRFAPEQLALELRPIAERLNEMLARLQSAFSRERRFADNIAHELRTPLTELRSTAEVAVKWPLDPHELPSHHRRVVAISERMSAVVERLLTLVRSDPKRLVARQESVDLLACLRVAWFSYESVASEHGVSIRSDTPDDTLVVTDPDILYSLLDNLFRNSATYAPPGSTIDCSVAVDPIAQSVVVKLTNVNADLTENDFANLEEPFWQKDAARSAGNRFGLGLSLVRQYANAINIRCRYFKPKENLFTVELTWTAPLVAAIKEGSDLSTSVMS